MTRGGIARREALFTKYPELAMQIASAVQRAREMDEALESRR